MTAEEFSANKWVDRLTQALPDLAKVQDPYLRQYNEDYPRVHYVFRGRNGNPPAFPLDDLRDLYAMARHSHVFSEEKYYADLLTVLNRVRHRLRSHPTLERVMSRTIGDDDFWMQIFDRGSSTSLTDLIAGLMARAAELSGDSFRSAAHELNAFLVPASEGGLASVPGDLNVGYDAMLFHGLTLKERIDIGDELAILPFEQVRAFVDDNLVEELAPPGAGFHGWRSVGAVVRPFRWKPAFRRKGDEWGPELDPPRPIFREAQTFLELLAVAHGSPLLRLAALPHCIDRSASRLLGSSTAHSGGFDRGRSAQAFNGFELSPEPSPEALAEVKEAFENRKSERYKNLAPVIGLLAEALARDGKYAANDKVLDVAIAVERMFKRKDRQTSAQLRERVAGFLGGDDEAQDQLNYDMKRFYNVRSAIIHGSKEDIEKLSLKIKNEAFDAGFGLAQKSLFKIIQVGPPQQ